MLYGEKLHELFIDKQLPFEDLVAALKLTEEEVKIAGELGDLSKLKQLLFDVRELYLICKGTEIFDEMKTYSP